ncbi:MAG: hypothetical protein ABSG83_12645 [Roseiarcus sp.]
MRRNLDKLAERVARAAEAALAAEKMVAPIDVLVGIGWLDPSSLKRWRQGQADCLERVVQANLSKLSDAMKLLRIWAREKGLKPSRTAYVAQGRRRQPLRFSLSGAPAIEEAYATHWISPELSQKKRERLEEKASRPPELVVIEPLNREWRCHKCGGAGNFLMMENPGPLCLGCAGLGDLEFLPAGDAGRTRRAKAASARSAVVVRFSRSRGRYERQGLLVEAEALAQAGVRTATGREAGGGAREFGEG